MNVKLSWSYSSTPSAQAPTQFTIQYKLASAPNDSITWAANQFVMTATSSPSISSSCSGGNCIYTISNLQDNKFYNFRIITDCAVGDDSISGSITNINLVCPVPTLTATSASINYSFTSAGTTSDVTSYVVQLLKSDNTVIRTATFSIVNGTISGVFDNTDGTLEAIVSDTTYKIRITVNAGSSTKICDTINITTSTTPPCNPGTGIAVCVCGDPGCTC